MVFGVADDGHANAEPRGNGSFWHAFCGVVRPLGVNIGSQIFQESFHVGFGEEQDVVHAAKRRDELCARVLNENRPPRTFQTANARIRINADDQNIAFTPRALQITDVSHVQRVEATVGENNTLAAALILRDFLPKQFTRHDFGSGLAHDSGSGSGGFAADGFEKLLARDGGGAALHDNQAAGNIGDVRGFEGRSTAGER